ncbi:MAG: universal stress protein [Gammaproteobacteria bacterium]|nr:universal stress protein [Gammaproteobacteria bacterium]
MSQTRDYTLPVIGHVLHPTDFSEGSRIAFHHALKAALLAQSELTLLHVLPGAPPEWMDFPGVRETLERWALLPKGSPRSAVPRLGIDVRKIVADQSDPVRAVLGYLGHHPADLIVLATNQHEGRVSWLQQSVAEPVSRRAGQMTLFIPAGAAGFVSATDGSVSLTKVLIPVADTPSPQPAAEAAARLVSRMNCPRGTFTLLHVGETSATPTIQCPEIPGWQWKRVTQTGDVIQVILDTASKTAVDLIVMATDGRNGFLDALRGSHSERVLRQTSAPLLTVPVGSLAGGHLV